LADALQIVRGLTPLLLDHGCGLNRARRNASLSRNCTFQGDELMAKRSRSDACLITRGTSERMPDGDGARLVKLPIDDITEASVSRNSRVREDSHALDELAASI